MVTSFTYQCCAPNNYQELELHAHPYFSSYAQARKYLISTTVWSLYQTIHYCSLYIAVVSVIQDQENQNSMDYLTYQLIQWYITPIWWFANHCSHSRFIPHLFSSGKLYLLTFIYIQTVCQLLIENTCLICIVYTLWNYILLVTNIFHFFPPWSHDSITFFWNRSISHSV